MLRLIKILIMLEPGIVLKFQFLCVRYCVYSVCILPMSCRIYCFEVCTFDLFRPMKCSILLHTIKSGCSIVFIEGSQVIISKTILYFFL